MHNHMVGRAVFFPSPLYSILLGAHTIKTKGASRSQSQLKETVGEISVTPRLNLTFYTLNKKSFMKYIFFLKILNA